MKRTALLLLSTLAFFSCSKREVSNVRIAGILALSGSGAEFGKDDLAGGQVAVDEINSSVNDVKIKFEVEDSRTQAKDGISAYDKIMNSSERPVAITTVMSSISMALSPLAERDHIPLFCVAAAPLLTTDKKYVFRSLPTSDYQAKALLAQSASKIHYRSVSVLYVSDDFGSSMAQAFGQEAEKNGITMKMAEGFQSEATNSRASVIKVIRSQPEAIFVAAFGPQLAGIVRQIKEIGFRGVVLGTLEIGYPKVLDVAKDAAEGVFFVDSRFDPASHDSMTIHFVEKFKDMTGRSPSLDAILSYDMIRMIYLAGSKRGFQSDSIRNGLLEIRNFQSPNGTASVQPNGDVLYELVLKKIENGKPIVVK